MESTASDPAALSIQEGTPAKKLFWRYTLPAIAGVLVGGLYTIIDGIFIGQYVGAEALAAMNMVWPVYGAIIGVALMSGMGTGTLYSIFRGQGNREKARAVLGSSISLMLLLAVLSGVLLFYFGHWPLGWMGAKEQILSIGTDYLTIVSLGSVPAMLGIALPMIVRNDERPTLSTLIMAAGTLLNIALDYLFIVVLEKGVSGAAIATVLSQAATGAMTLLYFFSSAARNPLTRESLVPDWNLCKDILKTGLPSLTMFLYISFVISVHNRLFLEYGTVITLAAFTIVGYTQAMFYMLAEGIANGVQPLISFSFGQNNNKAIHELLGMSLRWVVGVGLLTMAIINLFPEQLASAFNRDNPELLKETVTGFRLHLFAMFLDGFLVVAAAYFQALANYRLATYIALGNMFVQIPLLILLPMHMGVTGVWIALPLSNIGLAAVVLYFVLKDLKQRPA